MEKDDQVLGYNFGFNQEIRKFIRCKSKNLHLQQIQKRDLGKFPNYESLVIDTQCDYQRFITNQLQLKRIIAFIKQLQSNPKCRQLVRLIYKQFLTKQQLQEINQKLYFTQCQGHKSIQEFFVAKYIYNYILPYQTYPQSQNQMTVQELDNLDRLMNSVFNSHAFNINTDAFRRACSLITNILLNTENINQKLIEIVQQSIKIEFSPATLNSINLLTLMNVYLGSLNFNSIQLAGTNITGLSFFERNLSKSKLKNVAINSCIFNSANLIDIL
ncbi:unnamed protein product [Paramecium pentaurelia]|uniref:Uncharacterized protein n=1 Tax=Paramecium pentaurelia TaxID=43138 RepID=A0A8S1YLM8_9CILI|nr:unnamed protein product [Paramecium pentaurelia]